MGQAWSYDSDGRPLDVASGLEDGTGPWEHDWFIMMNLLGFTGTNIDAGGAPNTGYENHNAGAAYLHEDLPDPAKINGLVAVNGQMHAPGTGTGNGSRDDHNNMFLCMASGFLEFPGGIPLTAPGVALVLLATVGRLFNARPAKT